MLTPSTLSAPTLTTPTHTNAPYIAGTLCFLNTDHSSWLALRSQGIGGSDIPTIAGINPWQTRDQLFHRITHSITLEQTEAMQKGRDMESVIADRFAETFPYAIVNPNATYYSTEHPHFFATPDRILLDADKLPVGVLECKYSRYFSPQKRAMAELQLQWYLGVLGLEVGFIAVCEMDTFRSIPIMRNDHTIQRIQSLAHDFWCDIMEHLALNNTFHRQGMEVLV